MPYSKLRDCVINKISGALGKRSLFWYGSRAADALPLTVIPQFKAAYGTTGPLDKKHGNGLTFEELSGERVDIDLYSLAADNSPTAAEFRSNIRNSITSPCVLVPYTPTQFLSEICFANSVSVNYLGVFHELQGALEHKPWVESSLREMGVPTLDYLYFMKENFNNYEEIVKIMPVVWRPIKGSSGEGMQLISSEKEMKNALQKTDFNTFISISSYLPGAIPLNLSACVYPDKTVNLYPLSVQLIGIPNCTRWQFGYSGNDFGIAKDIDFKHLDQIDTATRQIGLWLLKHGYVGAFGVDYLLHRGKVYFTEINARFQASSYVSAQLSAQIDLPDVFIDHVAAHLKLSSNSAELKLKDIVTEQPSGIYIVPLNTSETPRTSSITNASSRTASDGTRIEMLANGATIAPGAILLRLIGDGTATSNGYSLNEEWSLKLENALDAL